MQTYSEVNALQVGSETDPFTIERYHQFGRLIPAGARDVLDVGCNTGRGGAALKAVRPEFRLMGFDCVQSRLDRLPAEVYHEAVLGDATSIPLPDDALDAIVAGEFIEHLYPRDVDPTLCEFFRVLRLGGTLLMTTPNPDDLKRRLKGGTSLGGAHLSQHFPDAMAARLRLIGFSRVRLLGSGKVTRYLGSRFPLLRVYGSYMVMGSKW